MNIEATDLSHFLREELTLSASEITFAMQKHRELSAPIPMVLWQYGLVSKSELDLIFNWLETRY